MPLAGYQPASGGPSAMELLMTLHELYEVAGVVAGAMTAGKFLEAKGLVWLGMAAFGVAMLCR